MTPRRFRNQLLLLVLSILLWNDGLLDAAQKGRAEKTKAFVMEITGAGRPMILIPGLSSGGNVWAGAVEHFKDRYECHVVTLAGFAGQPAIEGEPFLEQVRDGLIQYIRDKKLERPVIVGHSLGVHHTPRAGTIPARL